VLGTHAWMALIDSSLPSLPCNFQADVVQHFEEKSKILEPQSSCPPLSKLGCSRPFAFSKPSDSQCS
jgi:hypothetical protein